MMGTLQRVEQETVSSQSLANAIENMDKTRCDKKPTTIEGRRATLPVELVGQHSEGFARDCRCMGGVR